MFLLAVVSGLIAACGSSSPAAGPPSQASTTTTTSIPPAGPGATADLFVGSGVDVIALGPGAGPAQVFISTDGSQWRNITPAGLTQESPTGVTVDLGVDSVSFVDPDDGWLFACDQASDTDDLFATTDGGRTWTTLPPLGDCYHGDGPVQLLADGLGYRELSPEPDRSPFQRTTDGGHTWQTITRGAQTAAPWGTDFLFTDPTHGYSATGIQGDPDPAPYGSLPGQGAGYFATTRNGGMTWTASTPPVSAGGLRLYDLPTFTPSDQGVLPALGGSKKAPVLDFDATTDNGATWTTTATLPSYITAINNTFPDYPLASVVTSTLWWVYEPGPQPHIAKTTDGGKSWTTTPYRGAAPYADDLPDKLVAISATTAFIVSSSSRGMDAIVEVTHDGGQIWDPVILPAANQ